MARYNTPEQGTTDWHVPLNENFERMDTDIEVRDADGNLGQYEPRSGRKFLATDTLDVYLGNGDSWERVGNLDGGSGSNSITTTDGATFSGGLAAGNLVVVAAGSEVRIDPSGTDSPLQDAIDAVAASDGSGTVYLPPGLTQERGPVRVPSSAQGVHIQGTGISTDASGQRSSVVEITGSNVGFDVSGWGWKFASMDGFTLRGTGQNYPAIRFSMPDGEQWLTPRMFNIGRLRFSNWNPAPTGVVHYDDSHTFSCHYETLMFARNNSGPCFDFDSDSPLMLKITNLYADHGSRHPVFKSRTQSPGMVVDMCNVGGDHSGVLDLDTMTGLGFVQVNFMNWEPSTNPYSTDTVNRLNGPGYCYLPHTQVTGFGGGVDIDSVFELGSNNGNNVIGQIQTKGDVSIGRSKVDVTSRPTAPTYFYGSGSDVSNSAGTNTGLVRSLRRAGTGNA
ncbi:hypothetical protein [Haloarcula litorea]|uniref:hypothetical protein n=1 Tax=Haloarcula litorea TaxID=3032579 RepID=UPI0023E85785|nr:hypothetical protein [Halomicroarcula sp. GDY20]